MPDATSVRDMEFDLSAMPEIEIRILCRATLDMAKRFYSDPENVRKFEAWKSKQEEISKCRI